MDSTFPIKGRYVLAICLLPLFFLPGLETLYGFMGENFEWYWYDIVFYWYYHAIVVGVLAGLVFFHKINWLKMWAAPNNREYPAAIKLTAFIFVFSIATAYALFYPLSFLIPEFVVYWYIDIPPIIYYTEGVFPFFPNMLSFISLVVLAPIIEEFAFRGLLLHRWCHRFGMNKAIFFSSLLFGLAHPDLIGAFAFGVAMCVLYLKTQSLVVPMVCHVLNNFVAWLFEAGYIVVKGSDYIYTLQDFQSEWAIGLACGAISMLWAYAYFKGEKDRRIWSLPKI